MIPTKTPACLHKKSATLTKIKSVKIVTVKSETD